MDSEEMMQCPYNETHIILRSRMPFHMQKCVKNYKGPDLIKCPFNSMHLFKTFNDLKEHMTSGNCVDFLLNNDHMSKWHEYKQN